MDPNEENNNSIVDIKHLELKTKNVKSSKEASTSELIYEDSLDLTIKVTSEMSPEFKLLVYFINDREIVADSVTFKVKQCLKNKVDLLLKQEVVQVGKLVGITLKSDPNSVCALAAIDKSVSFMGKRNSIDFEKVFIRFCLQIGQTPICIC